MTTPALPDPASPAAPRWRKALLILAGLAGVGSFLWAQLPDGSYSTELAQIGQGRPALVLTLDPMLVGGAEMMVQLSGLRAEHESQVAFKVADLGMAPAREFASRHGASHGTVVLFAADGRRVGVLHPPHDTDALRQALNQSLQPTGQAAHP